MCTPRLDKLFLRAAGRKRQTAWHREWDLIRQRVCWRWACRRQFDFPIPVDHIAFRMPMLVSIVPIDLDKLFKNRCLTARALNCKECAVVKMALHLPLVLVVAVLGTKRRRAQ